MNSDSTLLQGVKIVSLALNAPGPVAAARLTKLGAEVTKVEPPSGDATKTAAPAWYESLCQGQTVLRLDLKSPEGSRRAGWFAGESGFIAGIISSVGVAEAGAGLGKPARAPSEAVFCRNRWIRCATQERTGHDLTYQSDFGLVRLRRCRRLCLSIWRERSEL